MPIQSPQFIFCPQCAQPLVDKDDGGSSQQFCTKCQRFWYHHTPVVAAAMVLNKHGRILLTQRGREPLKGLWTLPAGFSEFGEHPFITSERELYEETHLKARALRLLSTEVTTDHPQLITLVHFVEMSSTSGKILPNDDVTQARYFALTDLPDMAFVSHRKTVTNYLCELKGSKGKYA